jgi:hypothetical protein
MSDSKATGSILALLACVPLASACSAPANDVGRAESAVTISNGMMLNGMMLNGMLLNGTMLNGMMLNGMMLNGMMLNGMLLNGMLLNGKMLNGGLLTSQLSAADQLGSVDRSGATLGGQRLSRIDVGAGGLHATAVDGSALAGADLIGARLTGHTGIGVPVPLRIDDAQTDAAPNDDIVLYDVSYQLGNSWYPLCGVDGNGNQMPAVAVSGRWNLWQGVSSGGDHVEDGYTFTFGCIEDAVGKCARLGYKPWQKRQVCSGGTCTTVDLGDYHQACTRMVRADYCGDGRSHTVDGTVINVYDGIGIQVDDQPWYFEAEWVPAGARCVTHQRVVDLSVVPGCAGRLMDNTCGSRSHFATGTLLMDEYEVQPTRR